MAILEIKKAGAPVLKEVCVPVGHVDAKLRKLLDDMAETMYKANGFTFGTDDKNYIGCCVRAFIHF